MNIYHLSIKDRDDHQYDQSLHYSHPTKNRFDLHKDFNASYDEMTTNDEWDIGLVLDNMEKKYGWELVEDIPTVEVYY